MANDFATTNTGTHYGLSTTTITGTTLSGSLVSLERKKSAAIGEFTDGNENFLLVTFKRRTEEVNFDMVITATGNTTSASIMDVDIGSTLTINDPAYTALTGSYRITDITTKRAEGELGHYTGTAKRWMGATGYLS